MVGEELNPEHANKYASCIKTGTDLAPGVLSKDASTAACLILYGIPTIVKKNKRIFSLDGANFRNIGWDGGFATEISDKIEKLEQQGSTIAGIYFPLTPASQRDAIAIVNSSLRDVNDINKLLLK